MHRLLFAMVICALSFAAVAQDRSGRDTPSDWKVEHFVPFGLWDSVCDERVEDDGLRQRCYLHYVDVYSPRPDFLATFAFVYPKDGESIVEFGFERRTRYADQGLKALQDNEVVWTADRGCLQSSPCRLAGRDAQALLTQFVSGDVLVQDFRDRNGKTWRLEWDLSRFEAALADYRQASRQRGLLD